MQLSLHFDGCGCSLHFTFWDVMPDMYPELTAQRYGRWGCPAHGGEQVHIEAFVKAWELHHADNKPVYRVHRNGNRKQAARD